MEPPWSFNNFSSAPTFNLKWGRQRQLRCVKDPELTHPEFNSDSFRKRRSSSSSSDDGHDGGIEAVKDKLILDFRAEVDKMQSDFLKSPAKDVATAETETAELRPWNLRTRRAVCKDPNNSPEKITGEVKLAPKGVSCDGGGGGGGGGERRKFSVSLSKSEIADDFLMMTGGRPARRPKKRSKYVQRQIDAVSPGYWLTEITADMYKVDERPIDGGKK